MVNICENAFLISVEWGDTSLVPRLVPPPVFDCSYYVNMEEEGVGNQVMCSYTEARVDRQRAVPDQIIRISR